MGRIDEKLETIVKKIGEQDTRIIALESTQSNYFKDRAFVAGIAATIAALGTYLAKLIPWTH